MNFLFVALISVVLATEVFNTEPKDSQGNKKTEIIVKESLEKKPAELSGGMRKRVGLARALAMEPEVILYDEPTTGLHFADVERLLSVLNRLVERGHPLVVIEHNLDVIRLADHVIEIGPVGGDKGGQLVFQGSPKEIAFQIGESIGKKILEKKIEKKICFDRGGYLFHGRVKEFAMGVRSKGVKF